MRKHVQDIKISFLSLIGIQHNQVFKANNKFEFIKLSEIIYIIDHLLKKKGENYEVSGKE
ncbi:MAG: hypothetical protein EAX90_09870 [Candidatus Heimdallarchaeota archaeon]|nr:hypothetical protein [Candidatus Heimdallarchaeota archaeon]